MSNAFELISDLHKDARGFRPSVAFFDAFNAQSVKDQQTEWDALCVELVERETERKAAEADALSTFETRIQGMATDYNISEATALRWDMEGAGVDIAETLKYHGSAVQEIEHYLWNNGIAFTDMPRFVALAYEAFGLKVQSFHGTKIVI